MQFYIKEQQQQQQKTIKKRGQKMYMDTSPKKTHR